MFDEDEIDELQDQYMIEEIVKIGEGSFGKVYKAYDTSDNTICAVKVIPKSFIKDANLEQSILKSINHPHIVKFKRLCENKQNIYMVMELMEGGSLQQYINERKQNDSQITDEEASFIIKQILDAIYYMHENQIIHRDLKPENILLARKEDISSVKIADFGLSYQFFVGTSGRLLTQRCGTIVYMAPEQVSNQQYGKPVDLWSCGLIMYMLLSMGIHPLYKGNTDTKEKIVDRILNPHWNFNSSFSQIAIDFFRKLTTNSQSERYKAGQALLHPWISRNFDDEIPLTFEQRRSIFEKEQKISQVGRTFINNYKDFMKKNFLNDKIIIFHCQQSFKTIKNLPSEIACISSEMRRDTSFIEQFKRPQPRFQQKAKQNGQNIKNIKDGAYTPIQYQKLISQEQSRDNSPEKILSQRQTDDATGVKIQTIKKGSRQSSQRSQQNGCLIADRLKNDNQITKKEFQKVLFNNSKIKLQSPESIKKDEQNQRLQFFQLNGKLNQKLPPIHGLKGSNNIKNKQLKTLGQQS